jgi:hypothetical protein
MDFAQTYSWTKDVKYLETAITCAEYFVARSREGEGKWHHPLVPCRDFDASQDDPAEPLRDTSAGVITANGLLIIYQALQSLSSTTASRLSGHNDTKFLDAAVQIVSQTLDMCYDFDLASFETPTKIMVNGNGVNGGAVASELKIKETGFEGVLRNSTTNWNEHAHKQYADHGLVYADYYLLEFGNKLLGAGLL